MKKNKQIEFWQRSHNEMMEINAELGERIAFLEGKLMEIRREDLMGVVAQLPDEQRKSVKDYAEFLLDKYYREVESEE